MIQILLRRNRAAVLEFANEHPELLRRLVFHMRSTSVAQVLMKLLKADQDQAEDTDDDDGSVAQLDDQSAADGGAAVAAVVSESTVSSGGGLWASVVAGADGEGQKEDGAAGGGAAAVNVFTHPVVELLIGKLTLEQNTGAGAAADAGAGGGGGGDAEAAVTVGGTDRLHDLQDVHLNVAEVLEDIVYRTSGMLGGGARGT